jgi:hypothetical protein
VKVRQVFELFGLDRLVDVGSRGFQSGWHLRHGQCFGHGGSPESQLDRGASVRRENQVLLSAGREPGRCRGHVVLAGNESGHHETTAIIGGETPLVRCSDVGNSKGCLWYWRAAQVDNLTDNCGGARLCACRRCRDRQDDRGSKK